MTQPEEPTNEHGDQSPASSEPSMTSDTPAMGEPMGGEPAAPSEAEMPAEHEAPVPEPTSTHAAEAPEPPARIPGAYVPYMPPVASVTPTSSETAPAATLPEAAPVPSEPAAASPAPPPEPAPPQVTPVPMSAAASTDTEMWEVPPASAMAGAAAASQWSQPAPAAPQPAPAMPQSAPPPP